MSKKTDSTLKKCDDLIERLQELKKALGSINVASNRKPVNALGVGWSQDGGTGAFHHSTHGIINTMPHPEGGFSIRHGGGEVGRVGDISQAGLKIKEYVSGLGNYESGMHNRPSPNLPGSSKMGKPGGMIKGEDLEKSNYGPKGAGQYSQAHNAGRKMRNTGDESGIGPNVNTKAYSTKPGQLSAKAQASAEAAKTKKLSGPVKQYTPAQIAAINEARKLKKNAESQPWMNHNEFPVADDEVEKLKKDAPEVAENIMANQLANLMQGRAMLGTPPPKQPTDQQMFGHLAVTEEMEKAAQQQWMGNAFNSFLTEATKPISSRFASEEEEMAYWNSIKVSDKPDSDSGY